MLSSVVFPGFDSNSSQDLFTFCAFLPPSVTQGKFFRMSHLDKKLIPVLLWGQVCAYVASSVGPTSVLFLLVLTHRLTYQSCNPHDFSVGPQSSLVISEEVLYIWSSRASPVFSPMHLISKRH